MTVKTLRPQAPRIHRVVEGDDPIKLFVYGLTKAGKTYYAAKVIDLTPDTLLIDVDGGKKTVKGWPIDVVSVRSLAEFRLVYEEYITGQPERYTTIIIDTFSELYSFIYAEALSDCDNKPSQRVWGLALGNTVALVRAFRDLPQNVIMTCQAREFPSEAEGIIIQRPALPGQVPTQILPFFDVVAFIQTIYIRKKKLNASENVEGLQRIVYYASTPHFFAGARQGEENQLPHSTVPDVSIPFEKVGYAESIESIESGVQEEDSPIEESESS